MPQGEERRGVGQHSAPPGWVALVSDDQVLLVGGDGFEKNRRLFILIWGREVILKEQVQRNKFDPENEVEGSFHAVSTS